MSTFTPTLQQLVEDLYAAAAAVERVVAEEPERPDLWVPALERLSHAKWSYEAHRRNTTPT